MSKRSNITAALYEWILRVASNPKEATPEEVAALPEVARVYLDKTGVEQG